MDVSGMGASVFARTVKGVENALVQGSSKDVARAIDTLVKGLKNFDNPAGWAKDGLTLLKIAEDALGTKGATRFCQRFHDDLDALKAIATKLKNGGTIDQGTLRELSTILKRMDGNWTGLGSLSEKLGEVGAASILIDKRSNSLYALKTRVDAWQNRLERQGYGVIDQGTTPSLGRGVVA